MNSNSLKNCNSISSISTKQIFLDCAETSTDADQSKLPANFHPCPSFLSEKICQLQTAKKLTKSVKIKLAHTKSELPLETANETQYTENYFKRNTVISPPPVFKTANLVPRSGSINTKKEIGVKICEIEISELKRKINEFRQINIKLENENNILNKEKYEMTQIIERHAGWIRSQLEKNYTINSFLEDIKSELSKNAEITEKCVNSINKSVKILQKIAQKTPLAMLGSEIKLISENLAKFDFIWGKPKQIVENIIFEINNEIPENPIKIINFCEKNPEKLLNSEKEKLLIKIRELEDENNMNNIWKNKFTNLLMNYEKNDENYVKNCEKRNYENEIFSLNENIRKLKEENEKIKKENLQNNLKDYKEIDEAIYKLSLIILGKFNENTLLEKDAGLIRKIIGENLPQIIENFNKIQKENFSDCKNMLEIINNIVFFYIL